MTTAEFNKVLAAQIKRVQEILVVKAKEYATEDRLHNFKVVSKLTGVGHLEAVVNLMAKHTVSIYDMARSDLVFPPEVWDEKITDHINYLILLRAMVEEQGPSKL